MTPARIVAALVLALLVVAGLTGYAWIQLDEVTLSGHGLAALLLGVGVSLALGMGLMGLVFYSSRHGHDDEAG